MWVSWKSEQNSNTAGPLRLLLYNFSPDASVLSCFRTSAPPLFHASEASALPNLHTSKLSKPPEPVESSRDDVQQSILTTASPPDNQQSNNPQPIP
jgi:hypothetical protein